MNAERLHTWPRAAFRLYVLTNLALLGAFLWCSASSQAQSTGVVLPFGSYQGHFDLVNLANGGLHIDIPLFTHKARGVHSGVSVHLAYDSGYQSGYDFGWRITGATAGQGSSISANYLTIECPPPNYNNVYYQAWTYYVSDESGYRHTFPGTTTNPAAGILPE